MGKTYESITPDIAEWIEQQHVFFVATAPLSAAGHVNTSPKGLDCLRITGPRQVAYLDATGSGAETIAHLRENGRIVLMFCAFSGPPKIVRLHGKGTVVTRTSPHWAAWLSRFPAIAAPRSVIVADVTRVSDSCGYGVPTMDFKEERDVLARWAATKGPAALPSYRREKNAQSIDGLPAIDQRDA
jgi:Pyridoxamine 5'-phosphate oxidase